MLHFLRVMDLPKSTIQSVLENAQKSLPKVLNNQIVPLVFQKPSLRTRLSMEKAIYSLGGHPVILRQEDINIGSREPVKDVVRTISCYANIMALRVFDHNLLDEFVYYVNEFNLELSIINLLSDMHHPLQALADLLTIKQVSNLSFDELNKVKVLFIGDGNNVARSLAEISAYFEVSLTIASPKEYGLSDSFLNELKNPSCIRLITDPLEAIADVDFIYTDTWISMGQEDGADEKLKQFSGYSVTNQLLRSAKKEPFVMHCLPAHRGYEIEDSVIESPKSLVFKQAKNRELTTRSLLYHLITKAIW